MPDGRRIRFIAVSMTVFCVLLLPLIYQALGAGPPSKPDPQQKIALAIYFLALVCSPVLLVFSARGGSPISPRLAAIPFGWVGWQLVRMMAEATSRDYAPLREMAGTTAMLQLYLTLSFCLLVCGEVVVVLLRQDGSQARLAAATPLPSAVTARLYGGVLTLGFASVLMSSDDQVQLLLSLAGLDAQLWALKVSLFLMFLGGLALLLVPTSPLAAAACRLVSVVQAMLTMWVVYVMYDMASRFATGMGAPGADVAAAIWRPLASFLAFASVPVIFTWALGDEVVPDASTPDV